MKTVLILRHAKSDWSEAGQDDFDRSLAKRGREDAPRMGEVLARSNHAPDMILSSPAQRARQTTELVAQACGYGGSIRWEDSFYEGGSSDLIAALRGLPGAVERPLLVGHNPILEETVVALCSGYALKIPTAGLVCLVFDLDSWAEIEPGDGVLLWFLIPKLVKAIQG